MICPKCNGKFKEFEHKSSGVIFDFCLGCHATWFDKDEFWTVLKNGHAKKQFRKKGLINRKKTGYKCPKCHSPNTYLDVGVLPMTSVAVEHCNQCESFLFDKGEYKQAKSKIIKNSEALESFADKSKLEEIRSGDFSVKLFRHRLKKLNNDAHEITDTLERPGSFKSIGTFLARVESSFNLMIKEPGIVLFGLLQALSICIAYLLWIQMIDWIPEEVWKSMENSNDSSAVDGLLMLWSFVCVGFAALPVGLFTACIGATHILDSQGKESTITRCFKFVFPKIWPIWIFSWVDGWITVRQIVKRLPSSNGETAAQRAFSEAMYYAWKVGTTGVIPSLMTTKNAWGACKNSFGFLKHKTKDILLLRAGYSIVNWVVGILTYIGALFSMKMIDIDSGAIHGKMYEIYFTVGFPIFIAVGVLHLVVRPIYVLSLFDLYSDYMIETNQEIRAPKKNPIAQTALLAFSFLIVLIIVVFLFREELGIMEILATPYGETHAR